MTVQDLKLQGRPVRPSSHPEGAKRKRRSGKGSALLFVMPSIIAVGGSLAFSLAILVTVSLRDVNLGRLQAILNAPLSLNNYLTVLSSPDTWKSLLVSAEYVLGSTAIPFVLGFVVALLLNQEMPGRRLLRTLALVPWAIPSVTATVAFVWILQPTYGVWNSILRNLGLIHSDIDWFGNPSTAMWAVILPTSWKAMPFFTLMLLAGLQAISKELYEAAAVDGAGKFAQFRWITLPALAPFIFISVVFNAMHAFREFDFIYASTQGGPDGATETTSVRIFNVAFQGFHFGDASALGVATFAMVTLLVFWLYRHASRRSLDGFL